MPFSSTESVKGLSSHAAFLLSAPFFEQVLHQLGSRELLHASPLEVSIVRPQGIFQGERERQDIHIFRVAVPNASLGLRQKLPIRSPVIPGERQQIESIGQERGLLSKLPSQGRQIGSHFLQHMIGNGEFQDSRVEEHSASGSAEQCGEDRISVDDELCGFFQSRPGSCLR